jgi:hypothetical protein
LCAALWNLIDFRLLHIMQIINNKSKMIIKKRIKTGKFAEKKKDFKDGDILTILDAGVEMEGKFGPQTVFKIRLATGEFAMAFNNTSQQNLAEDFGEDTAKWIGKEAKISLIKQSVSGKIVDVAYLTHPDKSFEDYSDEADEQTSI